jgi:hypothetical protein
LQEAKDFAHFHPATIDIVRAAAEPVLARESPETTALLLLKQPAGP